MIEWLQRFLVGFSAREHLLVVSALALGALSLLFIGIVEPLSTARTTSAGKLADRIELLEWMTARMAEVRTLRQSIDDRGAEPTSGPVGIAEIEVSLGARGLRPALTRLTPRPGGRFEARFEDVSYKALIEWLADSYRRSGVSVTEIVIDATDRPDHVDAELSAATRKGGQP